MICVVDSGPLYAAADLDDAAHGDCVQALAVPGRPLVIPALVVAEVAYLIGTRLGAHAEARFAVSLQTYDVAAPLADEWPRIAELVWQYRDFRLGTTDASVVALAECLGTVLVATLDRRHFQAIRPAHGAAFQLIP